MNIKNSQKILAVAIPIMLLLSGYSASRALGISPNAPKKVFFKTASQGDLPGTPQPLVLTDEQGQYPLGFHMEILEDPSAELTIEEVSSAAYASRFTPSQVAVPNYGYTDSAYWVRLNIYNQTLQTNYWLLDVGFANMQYVDLYSPLPNGGGFTLKQSGTLRPLSTRDIFYPRIIFTLAIPNDSEQTIYMRFKNGASMTIPLTLWKQETFLNYAGPREDLMGVLYGVLFGLLIFNIFLLISLRETSYLYLVLFLASYLLFNASYDGYLEIYLFSKIYYLRPAYIALFFCSIHVMMLLFGDKALELKTRLPLLHRIVIIFLAVWGILLLMVPFTSYRIYAELMVIWALPCITGLLVGATILWKQKYTAARFFMVTWFVYLIGMILALLVRLGVIPSSTISENIYRVGAVWMALGMSIALADRINLLKGDTENANRELRNSEHKLTQILEGLPLGVVVYGKDQKPTYINQRTVDILSSPTQDKKPDASSGRTLGQAISYFSFHKAGTGLDYPVDELPVSAALNGTPASADDLEMDRGDTRVPLEIWASPIRDDEGNVNAAVAVFQDITQRKLAEAELALYQKQLELLVTTRTIELDQVNQRLQLRLEWLYLVIKIQQMIKGMDSLALVSEEMCNNIYQLLSPISVFILRWDDKRDSAESYSYFPKEGCIPDTETAKISFQKGSPLRHVLESGKIIALSSEHGDTIPAPILEWCQDHDIQLAMFAPILIGQSLFGVLGVLASNTAHDFILQQTDLIERMGLDLASLFQDAVLLDQTLALVALDERNHLARDLHDSVTQVLFSATLLTEVMPQIWRRDPEQGFQTLDKLRRLTRGALAEMRTMLIELRPTAVINTPLSELLAQLTEAITSRSGVPFQLFIEQIPILPDDVQMNFYRIAQEALNNVVNHAQAMQVSVSLNETQVPTGSNGSKLRIVKLIIEDDGVGFYSGNIQAGHLGISIMHERATAIQAALVVVSEPGHGTLVSLTWRSEPEAENQNE